MKYLFLALVLTGCASFPTIEQERQTAASGFVGCAPGDIQVSDHKSYTWTSACKGRVFYCTVSPDMSCKESIN